jgi:hypothetical protein
MRIECTLMSFNGHLPDGVTTSRQEVLQLDNLNSFFFFFCDPWPWLAWPYWVRYVYVWFSTALGELDQ